MTLDPIVLLRMAASIRSVADDLDSLARSVSVPSSTDQEETHGPDSLRLIQAGFPVGEDGRPKLLLRVEEAASLLAVHRSTAYEWIRDDQLPAIRVGTQLRIPAIRLLDLLGGSTRWGSLTATPSDAVSDQ